MEIEYIQTPDAPTPAGHYSQAVVHDGVIYVSGQLPVDPRTGERMLGSIEEQTRQVLENVLGIVRAAGGDRRTLLKVTVYVSDISLWSRVNAVYVGVMGDARPARVVVPTRELHHGFLIEADALAAVTR